MENKYSFDSRLQQEFSDYFQPRLLQYRFEHYRQVATSAFDIPEFSFPLRDLARSLGMCINDPTLRSQIIDWLGRQDRETRLEQSLSLPAIVLEALLYFCHDPNKQAVVAKEVATITCAILQERGETLELSPKRAGTVLRNLGLFTERVGKAGLGIYLTEGVRRRIHRLAREYGVASIQSGTQLCRHCGADDEISQQGQQGEPGNMVNVEHAFCQTPAF